MSDDDPGQEAPDRRPDVWLAPGASAPGPRPSSAPTSGPAPGAWRQPPAWRSSGPSTWRQPPLTPGAGPSDSTPPGGPRSAAPNPYAGPSPYAKVWPAGPVGRPSPFRGALLGLGISLGVLGLLVVMVVAVGVSASGRSSRPTSPTGRASSGPPPGTVGTVWSSDPAQLRPGLSGARFLGSLDGSFEQSYVREIAGRWLTITGSDAGSQTALHALDPATGAVLWQRELDGVLCATDAGSLETGGTVRTTVYCASVLERDRDTGLGTRWRLHVLDPASGQDLATADVDAWVTAVHVRRGTFVLLEQRQPAPHAVVRGFSADLRERWSLDLADRPGQAEMFTEDRVVLRPEPERPGLALDRPRLRDVGDGLLAVWAGQRTAFVEPSEGRLVMMPHCSRLVDDGDRLWCNEVDGATAYGYDGKQLVRVRGPRLAFPGDDGIGEDRNRPVFLDDDGAGVAVDTKTGKVGAAWTPPGRGSAFGQTTMPSTESAGGRTFLVGKAGTMLLEEEKDRVVWRNTDVTVSDAPVIRGGTVLLGSTRATAMDLATGRTQEELRFEGLYVVALGTRVAGVGPDELSLSRW